MTLPELLIWYPVTLLLLLAGAFGLLILRRKLQGRALFTQADWLLPTLGITIFLAVLWMR